VAAEGSDLDGRPQRGVKLRELRPGDETVLERFDLVATTSDSQSAPEDRVWVENSMAGSENIRFAMIVPSDPPTVCAAV
jgi:hypothetical protein